MTNPAQLVVFRIEGRQYALALTAVERIILAVEVTPLHNAPASVLGVIDLSGRVIPVFDMRQRLRLPERTTLLSDQILIARTSQRMVALIIDAVHSVVELPAGDFTPSSEIIPGLEMVTGVAKLPDGLVLIHDLGQFLSLDEESVLNAALNGQVANAS